MMELHPKQAIATAESARLFLASFAFHDFSEFACSGPHDRRALAMALDHIEELSAMVLNLAARVTPNAEIKGQAGV